MSSGTHIDRDLRVLYVIHEAGKQRAVDHLRAARQRWFIPDRMFLHSLRDPNWIHSPATLAKLLREIHEIT